MAIFCYRNGSFYVCLFVLFCFKRKTVFSLKYMGVVLWNRSQYIASVALVEFSGIEQVDK